MWLWSNYDDIMGWSKLKVCFWQSYVYNTVCLLNCYIYISTRRFVAVPKQGCNLIRNTRRDIYGDDRIYPPILMNGLLQRREGLRVHDDTQSFSEYDSFRNKKVSLCVCYIYNWVSSWWGMAKTVALFGQSNQFMFMTLLYT